VGELILTVIGLGNNADAKDAIVSAAQPFPRGAQFLQ
jgi:hypothetical protein